MLEFGINRRTALSISLFVPYANQYDSRRKCQKGNDKYANFRKNCKRLFTRDYIASLNIFYCSFLRYFNRSIALKYLKE